MIGMVYGRAVLCFHFVCIWKLGSMSGSNALLLSLITCLLCFWDEGTRPGRAPRHVIHSNMVVGWAVIGGGMIWFLEWVISERIMGWYEKFMLGALIAFVWMIGIWFNTWLFGGLAYIDPAWSVAIQNGASPFWDMVAYPINPDNWVVRVHGTNTPAPAAPYRCRGCGGPLWHIYGCCRRCGYQHSPHFQQGSDEGDDDLSDGQYLPVTPRQ